MVLPSVVNKFEFTLASITSRFVKEEFNDAYFYDGSDLGTVYSKDKTSFRLWAPLAEKVVLMTYKDGDVDSSDPGTAYEMKRHVKGTWVKTLEGDQKGLLLIIPFLLVGG